MSIAIIILLSFVEGLTEFLPVSSTGHLIITSALLGIQEEGFVKSFNIIIQSGAILSVLFLYWRRFKWDRKFYSQLLMGFLPAAVIGLLVKKKIDFLLGSVTTVAIALLVGGVLLIALDRKWSWMKKGELEISDLSFKDCFMIGLIQCLAFFPGFSRSGATIIGGILMGLKKKEAAEFSFFLAVPTLIGASLVKGLGLLPTIEPSQWSSLGLGIFLSFVFALITIKFFISVTSRFGFTGFGVYRIVVSFIIFYLINTGVI